MVGKSMFNLSGRVALVMAGGHLLGRAYCEAMAEFGADVACSDVRMDVAREKVELIRKVWHRYIALEADIYEKQTRLIEWYTIRYHNWVL